MARPPKNSVSPLARVPGAGIREDELELGYISGVFGVRGEVRLFLFHRSSLLTEQRDVVLVDGSGGRWQARLVARLMGDKRVSAVIEGVTDREVAREMMKWKVVVRKADLPAPEPGEFYVWQVEGIHAYVGDSHVGTVVTVQSTEAGDIFEIEVDGELHFVPSIEAFVVSLDIDAGKLVLSSDALESS